MSEPTRHRAARTSGAWWSFVSPGVVLMALAFAAPLGFVVWLSVTDEAGRLTLDGYASLYTSTLFWRVTWNTLVISVLVSVLAALLGYPIALHLSRQRAAARRLLLTLVLVPFWTSVLVKSYAFIIVLGKRGLLNDALQALGLGALQMDLLFNRSGMVIAMAHQMIPFVVLPLLASLLEIDRALYRAAHVAGANAWQTFCRVTLPLSLPGLGAGFLLSFMLSIGAYVTPALLGSRRDLMLANLIDFRLRESNDWHGSSAIAVTILVVCLLLLWAGQRVRALRNAA